MQWRNVFKLLFSILLYFDLKSKNYDIAYYKFTYKVLNKLYSIKRVGPISSRLPQCAIIWYSYIRWYCNVSSDIDVALRKVRRSTFFFARWMAISLAPYVVLRTGQRLQWKENPTRIHCVVYFSVLERRREKHSI